MTDEQTCPKCGKPMVVACDVPGCNGPVETYSRVVGYLRPVSTWNPGKQQEFKDRREYELRHGSHAEPDDAERAKDA